MESNKNITDVSKYNVCVRIRPSTKDSPKITFTAYKNKYVKEFKDKSILTYAFDYVFEPHHTNQDIYQIYAEKIVNRFIEKKINTTILAYGQTGSGKTYTLFGHKTNPQEQGLSHFIVNTILDKVLGNKKIFCNFMQIYKEKVTDLTTNKSISLKQNSKGQLILQQLNYHEVKSKQHLNQLIQKANQNKIFGNSYINSESSRSHVIFQISINDVNLNIADLCGNQVLTYQFNQKQRQQTNSINLSLFTLNSVVSDIMKKTSQHIPFRNSVLTRILKNSLANQKSQVLLFCNISPQKQHRELSESTLKFGQLAISIDDIQAFQQEGVNLSQQKRQKKKITNIIEVSLQPENYEYSQVNWKVSYVSLFKKKVKIYQINNGKQKNILFLHAYGYGCDGQDWNFVANKFNKQYNCYSVDFPGFGQSEGNKFTSRAQKFTQKGQSIDFLIELFKIFKISPKNKVILVGYDLGGAIALASSFHFQLSKSIEKIIVFHPTWTDSFEKLAQINIEVLILWFTCETFHLISAGNKMAKLIKNSLLYRINIGAYSSQKAGGYLYKDKMSEYMLKFIQTLPQSNDRQQNIRKGVVLQQKIFVQIDEKEQKLIKNREALIEFTELVRSRKHKSIYNSIIKTDENKPKAIRLALDLPQINQNTTIQDLFNCQIIKKIPQNIQILKNLSFLAPFQQIQVKTTINLSVLKGNQNYLTYSKNGELGITHKAFICPNQDQTNIKKSKLLTVEIDVENSKEKQIIQIDLKDVIKLNHPTLFRKNVNNDLVFQDSVTCKYSSMIMKLKMIECCLIIGPIINQIQYTSNTYDLLELQMQCTKRIYKTINLSHLVHQGIDKTRYTGIDVGRLAYKGQGNCHHLASVLAAFLIPFGKIFGWSVIFRAGSFFKSGRQLDEYGEPLPSWDGKPKVKVQDHTWLEITYKPSYQTRIFDPSFEICNYSLDQVYSKYGKMHISERVQCNSQEAEVPTKLYNQKFNALELTERKFWKKDQYMIDRKPLEDWTTQYKI